MHPRQSPTTHTEQLGDEASVYDWARAQVHALNPTAAFVWRRCDGATSPATIAAAVQRELNLPEAEAVVDLALTQLARLHLLAQPAVSDGAGHAPTRRWLLGRGVAAAMVPAIASIVAPTPVEAQSPGPVGPTLTSVEPNQGIQGTTVAVRLNGTNFVVGATTVEVSGDVPVEKVVVDSSTSLTASFVLDSDVRPGTRTVRVRTAAGTSDTVHFRITRPSAGGPTPTLTAVAPNQGVRGSTAAVTLTGTHFVAGGTTVDVAGGGVTVTNVVVISATSLTANFVLDAAAAAGARAVTVTTDAGTSGPQTFAVTLSASAPTLTTVVPNQGVQGSTVAVTLTGADFVVGGTTVAVSGAGVTVSNVIVASSTSLTASFVLDAAAAEGPRLVAVSTAAGTSGPQTFTVTLSASAPTLTTVAPNQGVRGSTLAVTLTGTNFVVGATTVNVAGGGVTVNNVVVGSSTSLTADFVLDPATTEGPRLVAVTTAAGTSGTQTFTVSLPAPGVPTLTSVLPNQGLRGATVAVTLTGTNFVVGATTVAVAGGGVTVTSIVVGNTTSLTANFVVDPAATEGPRPVTVSTAAGTSGPQTFTVSPPTPGAPTLTSVAPNQGLRGATVAVTLTGTNFVVGATTVAVSSAGVTVTNIIVGSTTSLTANFVLDLAAAAGPRTVTVTTAGGTSNAQAFTISLPASGFVTFDYTGRAETFTVPAGVVSVTILATGASGGGAGGPGGLGGRIRATVSVTPGAPLTVRVGGQGIGSVAGFNGGGGATGMGGGGGGASSVRNGATALVVVGGGGGGGASAGGGTTIGGGNGAAGGGVIAAAGGSANLGGGGGGGGTQATGGAAGTRGNPSGTDGTAGVADQGGTGGAAQPGVAGGGGGGGGGGYFGGGGGGGGNPSIAGAGGGGGSSFTAPGATGVLHDPGVKGANGFVTISW